MADDLSAERASELIGGIYDCALDPSLWPVALDRIRLELDFFNAVLAVNELPSFTTILSFSTGIPERWERRMHELMEDVATVWGGTARLMGYPLDEPIVQSQVVGRALFRANRYYQEWAKPQGIIEGVAIGFMRDESMLGSIGMGRHENAGEVGESELAALRIIAPHFRRAVSISKLLDLRAVEVQTFAAALDAVAAGVLLVDAGMRVLHANGTAAVMLQSGDAILTRRGVLQMADPDAMRRLQAAVAAAAEDEATLGRRGIGVPVRARSGDPAVAHVLPLRRGQAGSGPRSGLLPRAVAAVFVAPAPERPLLPGDALAALYDLTPAEVRVMELIADGRTMAEIGPMIGIALSTVKTHLQRVFAKTGCRRQVELANLARSLRQPG